MLSIKNTCVNQEQDNTTTKDSGYDGILKYAGLFGGVQGLVSLITLFKVSIVSRLLGPVGVGIIDVYNRSIELGKKATDLGISYSAVQAISERRGDSSGGALMEYAVKVVRSWALWLSIFGTFLFFLLAPLLSRWSFDGDAGYTPMFRLLSLTVGSSALMMGELAVLKGGRMLGRVAKYQLASALVMLLVVVPCYYFWDIKGIVPGLLLSAVGILAVACWYSFKVFPYRVQLFSKQIIVDGLYIIRQGFNYTFAGLLNSGAYYLISIYLFSRGSAGEVGCYSYGNLLISYLSMLVFAALDSEFFPRLSAVNKDRNHSNKLVNSQVEVLLVLMTPLVVCFAVCLPLVPRLLLDIEFMPLVEMAQLGVVGLFFKALMLPPAYLSLSKGESRVFLLQEALSYTFMAAVMIGGFEYYGLKGLGAGMLLSGVFDWLTIWLISVARYGFRYSSRVCRLVAIQLPMLCCMLIVCLTTHRWLYTGLGTVLMTCSAVYSIRFLYKNTDFIHRILVKIRRGRS